MKNLKLFFIFLALMSCSRVDTLNLRPHLYSAKAEKIIWFQVPGLLVEHLALLRYSLEDLNKKTALENVHCVGESWNFNLYNLRPSSRDGFISQMFGTKNIKGKCSDYDSNPVWNYLSEVGIKTGILEFGVEEEDSIEQVWECGKEYESKRKDLTLWRMAKNEKSKDIFHFQEKSQFENGKIYYDKTCHSGNCLASLQSNAEYLWNKFSEENSQNLFIIRNEQYLNALKEKNITKAREVLIEIDNLFQFFLQKSKLGEDFLVILSSTAPRRFEFPEKGVPWAQFERSGKNIAFRSNSLVSPVFASGSSAENFCGIYEENEILKRILWIPEIKKLNLGLIKGLFD